MNSMFVYDTDAGHAADAEYLSSRASRRGLAAWLRRREKKRLMALFIAIAIVMVVYPELPPEWKTILLQEANLAAAVRDIFSL
jgi:hypothetical protein